MKLLDVASVTTGDSRWTAGLDVENLQCSLSSGIAGLCLPAPAGLSVTEGQPSGWPLSVFAVIVKMRRSNLCMDSDPEVAVKAALEAEKDKAAGRALWFGTGNASMWLGATGVTALPSTAGVGEALKAFYDNTVGVDPIIHMGIGTAIKAVGLNAEGRFKAFADIPIVVNPSYPVDALAVTGPIEVRFTSAESMAVQDIRVNRGDYAADLLGAISFDPCAAFVVGNLPDQVYVGAEGNEATVYVVESQDAATVSWGDATADDSIPAGANSPVTHTYASAGSHTITVTSNSGVTTYDITTA